jgi:hypothetical protein
LLTLQRNNKQKLQELSHDLNVAEIDLLKMQIELETDLQIKTIQAQKIQ